MKTLTERHSGQTDPFDINDYLRITDFQTYGTTNDVTWPVKTTRLYTLHHASVLSNGMNWTTTSSSFIPPFGPSVTESVIGVTDTNRFYRVEAASPLSPELSAKNRQFLGSLFRLKELTGDECYAECDDE